jgi:hypothetical protein
MDAPAVTTARIGCGTGSGNVPTGCKYDCSDRGAIRAALADLPAALPALAADTLAPIEPRRQSYFLECLDSLPTCAADIRPPGHLSLGCAGGSLCDSLAPYRPANDRR